MKRQCEVKALLVMAGGRIERPYTRTIEVGGTKDEPEAVWLQRVQELVLGPIRDSAMLQEIRYAGATLVA